MKPIALTGAAKQATGLFKQLLAFGVTVNGKAWETGGRQSSLLLLPIAALKLWR